MVSMAARWLAGPPLRGAAMALLLALQALPAPAAELVGRVVDAVEAKVFAGATVTLRGGNRPRQAARTDASGFFRVSDLAPGAYLLDVGLPDRRAFVARLLVLAHRPTQFLELDYSRAVPPDDDEDY
jgi:hypothetical protein